MIFKAGHKGRRAPADMDQITGAVYVESKDLYYVLEVVREIDYVYYRGTLASRENRPRFIYFDRVKRILHLVPIPTEEVQVEIRYVPQEKSV